MPTRTDKVQARLQSYLAGVKVLADRVETLAATPGLKLPWLRAAARNAERATDLLMDAQAMLREEKDRMGRAP